MNPDDRPAARPAEVGPLSPDRPVVDGTAVSSAELRTALAEQSDERRAGVEELRSEVGETVAELAGRFDLPSRWRDRREEWTARSPAVLAAAALVVIALLVRARRRE